MENAGRWIRPETRAPFPENAIHLWRATLDGTERQLGRLETVLGTEERRRARAFRGEVDRKRYLASHGILRILLSRYLKRKPQELEYVYDGLGKPRLSGRNGVPISYSISHSSGMALYAFASGHRIGVDLECVQPLEGAQDIVLRYFAQDETALLLNCDDDCRQEAFFRIWTLKEAYVKAIGEGMQCPFDRFSISHCPLCEADSARISDRGRAGGEWVLKSVVPSPRYVGAVAFEGSEVFLTKFDWCDG
jgi:4'-phosphopantetheinyl transferase